MTFLFVILFVVLLCVIPVLAFWKLFQKSRKIFYPIGLGTAAAFAIWPIYAFEPEAGWGMGGLLFYYYWAVLIGISVLFYLFYEFKHQPNEPIRYDLFRKIINAYGLTLVFVWLIIAYFGIFARTNGEGLGWLVSGEFFWFAAILVIASVVFYWVQYLIRVQRPGFYKLFIFINLGVILALLYGIPSIGYTKRYSEQQNSEAQYNQALEELNYEACLQTKFSFRCNDAFALKTGDALYCLRNPDYRGGEYYGRYDCIMELAKKTQDESVCEAYNQEGNRGHDTAYCKAYALAPTLQARTQGMTTSQITAQAISAHDLTLCFGILQFRPSGIKNIDESLDCQLAVIKSAPDADASLCNIMLDRQRTSKKSGVEECYAQFGIKGKYDYQKGFIPAEK